MVTDLKNFYGSFTPFDRTAKIGWGTHCFQQASDSPIGWSGANYFGVNEPLR